eukprot:gene3068-13087_t
MATAVAQIVQQHQIQGMHTPVQQEQDLQGQHMGAPAGVDADAGFQHTSQPPVIPQCVEWATSLELESRMKAELKKQGFWSVDVRQLRGSLQKAYESVLFANYEFAQAHEVEQNLWKHVFYKPLEDFRSRVHLTAKNLEEARLHPSSFPPEKVQEIGQQQQKLTSAYLKFLDTAIVFYKRLVWKLQWVYGHLGTIVELDASMQNDIRQSVPKALEPRDCHTAVHRCLIYLGDLCRYQSQAANVLPISGNPFNQMAVMSFYDDDELTAVYYYFRSLGAASPFLTARDNLALLLEQNRDKYLGLPPPGRGGSPDKLGLQASTRFVRLHGMLFGRLEMEKHKQVADATFLDLELLLGHEKARENFLRGPSQDNLLIHLVAISAFTVFDVGRQTASSAPLSPSAAATLGSCRNHSAANFQSSTHSSTTQEYAPLSPALELALLAMIRLGTVLCRSAAAAHPTAAGYTALMVGLHSMAMWLQSNPSLLTLAPLPANTQLSTAERGGRRGGRMSEEGALRRMEFYWALQRLVQRLRDEATQRKIRLNRGEGTFQPAQLPEDSELMGFQPLGGVLAHPSTWAKSAPDEASMRLQRTLLLLKSATASMLLPPFPDLPLSPSLSASSGSGASTPVPLVKEPRRSGSTLTAALASAPAGAAASEATSRELHQALVDLKAALDAAHAPRLARCSGGGDKQPQGGTASHASAGSNALAPGKSQTAMPSPPSIPAGAVRAVASRPSSETGLGEPGAERLSAAESDAEEDEDGDEVIVFQPRRQCSNVSNVSTANLPDSSPCALRRASGGGALAGGNVGNFHRSCSTASLASSGQPPGRGQTSVAPATGPFRDSSILNLFVKTEQQGPGGSSSSRRPPPVRTSSHGSQSELEQASLLTADKHANGNGHATGGAVKPVAPSSQQGSSNPPSPTTAHSLAIETPAQRPPPSPHAGATFPDPSHPRIGQAVQHQLQLSALRPSHLVLPQGPPLFSSLRLSPGSTAAPLSPQDSSIQSFFSKPESLVAPLPPGGTVAPPSPQDLPNQVSHPSLKPSNLIPLPLPPGLESSGHGPATQHHVPPPPAPLALLAKQLGQRSSVNCLIGSAGDKTSTEPSSGTSTPVNPAPSHVPIPQMLSLARGSAGDRASTQPCSGTSTPVNPAPSQVPLPLLLFLAAESTGDKAFTEPSSGTSTLIDPSGPSMLPLTPAMHLAGMAEGSTCHFSDTSTPANPPPSMVPIPHLLSAFADKPSLSHSSGHPTLRSSDAGTDFIAAGCIAAGLSSLVPSPSKLPMPNLVTTGYKLSAQPTQCSPTQSAAPQGAVGHSFPGPARCLTQATLTLSGQRGHTTLSVPPPSDLPMPHHQLIALGDRLSPSPSASLLASLLADPLPPLPHHHSYPHGHLDPPCAAHPSPDSSQPGSGGETASRYSPHATPPYPDYTQPLSEGIDAARYLPHSLSSSGGGVPIYLPHSLSSPIRGTSNSGSPTPSSWCLPPAPVLTAGLVSSPSMPTVYNREQGMPPTNLVTPLAPLIAPPGAPFALNPWEDPSPALAPPSVYHGARQPASASLAAHPPLSAQPVANLPPSGNLAPPSAPSGHLLLNLLPPIVESLLSSRSTSHTHEQQRPALAALQSRASEPQLRSHSRAHASHTLQQQLHSRPWAQPSEPLQLHMPPLVPPSPSEPSPPSSSYPTPPHPPHHHSRHHPANHGPPTHGAGHSRASVTATHSANGSRFQSYEGSTSSVIGARTLSSQGIHPDPVPDGVAGHFTVSKISSRTGSRTSSQVGSHVNSQTGSRTASHAESHAPSQPDSRAGSHAHSQPGSHASSHSGHEAPGSTPLVGDHPFTSGSTAGDERHSRRHYVSPPTAPLAAPPPTGQPPSYAVADTPELETAVMSPVDNFLGSSPALGPDSTPAVRPDFMFTDTQQRPNSIAGTPEPETAVKSHVDSTLGSSPAVGHDFTGHLHVEGEEDSGFGTATRIAAASGGGGTMALARASLIDGVRRPPAGARQTYTVPLSEGEGADTASAGLSGSHSAYSMSQWRLPGSSSTMLEPAGAHASSEADVAAVAGRWQEGLATKEEHLACTDGADVKGSALGAKAGASSADLGGDCGDAPSFNYPSGHAITQQL